MGGITCCPKREDYVVEAKTPDIVEEMMKNKLTPRNIMYDYTYESVKVCLIKAEQVDGFFKNKNLFKLPQYDEQSCYYYNGYCVTNFLGKRNIILLLLQHINLPKKNLNESFVYHIEEICYLDNASDNSFEKIKNDIASKTNKNFLFTGVINNTKKLNRMYKLIYKKNIQLDLEVSYDIHVHKGSINEEGIKYILGENEHKGKLLKAILPDKLNGQMVYFFIFEKNLKKEKEYDYITLQIEKNNTTENEYFLIELARKLNNFEIHNYKLCSLISEKSSTYLILYRDKETFEEDDTEK
jgi:hypothetical protein